MCFFFDSFFIQSFQGCGIALKYFNQQDELLFDPVVETLNNLNSPDNGYLTDQSSSEPSPSITNTVQQQLPPPPPAPPAQTVTVSTPPKIYELSTLRPVNQSNLTNAFQILVVNANPQTAIQPSQTTNQQHNQPTSPIVVSERGVRAGTVRGPYKKKSQENIENIQN